MEPIVLASASPRRGELLKQISVPFIVCPAAIDESIDLSGKTDFESLCIELAKRKISAVLENQKVRGYRWFLGADTIVISGKKSYGKPKDRDEARLYLESLSGKRHKVITGAALFDRKTERFDAIGETATVKFAALRPFEIEWYLETGEWQGVAGGYRIQEKAACFIEGIRGNYSTVMGLPIRSIYVMLLRNRYPFGDGISSVDRASIEN